MKGNLSVFQVILLAVFGALAISGVLIFALATAGNVGNSVGPVRIWGTLPAPAFATVIRQIAENDARLSQVTYEYKDPTTFESDLTNALASESGPDLFLLRQDYAYKDVGKVAPIPYGVLSQTQFENTFVVAARPYLAAGGVLGIPLSVDPLVLYWNRDLLGAAGFAKPPQYWFELNDMVRAISKKNDSGAILKSGISFGEYRNVTNAKDILAMLILQAGGPITAKDATGRLVSALSARAGDATQAGESALRFYTGFADPSKPDAYSWNRSLPESQRAFASGDLALYIGYASEAPLLARMNPNLNFAAAPVPQLDKPDKPGTPIDVARVYALAASRTGHNIEGATKVALLLTSTENSRSLSEALGIPSARRDVLAKEAQGNDNLFRRQVLIARSWIDPDPEKTGEIFRGMIEDVTTGASLISEAVQKADQKLAQLVGL